MNGRVKDKQRDSQHQADPSYVFLCYIFGSSVAGSYCHRHVIYNLLIICEDLFQNNEHYHLGMTTQRLFGVPPSQYIDATGSIV